MRNDQREKHTQQISQKLQLRRVLMLVISIAVLLLISIFINQAVNRDRNSGAKAQFQPAITSPEQVDQQNNSFPNSNQGTSASQISTTTTVQPLLANTLDPSNSKTASPTLVWIVPL